MTHFLRILVIFVFISSCSLFKKDEENGNESASDTTTSSSGSTINSPTDENLVPNLETPEDFLTLAAVEIEDGEITVSWQSAQSNTTELSDIVYEVFTSDSSNITTLDEIKTNGTKVGETSGSTSLQISGITIDKDFYFNVIASDSSGLQISYSMRSPFCGGTGVNGDEYIVCDAGSLQWMRLYLDQEFSVSQDIDLTGSENWNSGAGFLPIRDCGPSNDCLTFGDNVGFTGKIDGQSNSISNIVINRPSLYGTGLFGDVRGNAVIANFDLVNAKITGGDETGGVIGSSYDSSNPITVTNIKVSGQVSGAGYVGGIVGYAGANQYTLTGCKFVGSVTATDQYAGGIAGTMEGDSSCGTCVFQDNHVVGSVTGVNSVGGQIGYSYFLDAQMLSSNSNVTGNNSVGGLIGNQLGNRTLSNSLSSGNVVGLSNIGGIAGYSESSIVDTYSSSNVHGSNNVGGIVGSANSTISRVYTSGNIVANAGDAAGISPFLFGTGRIEDSFAIGNISATGSAGTAIGSGGSFTFSNLFRFNHTFNPSNCHPGGNSDCTSLTNPTWFYEIDNYDGSGGDLNWDFSASGPWIMPQTGKYPVLQWENTNDPIAFPPEFRNGRKIGISDMATYRVWGFCGTPDATISFTGPNAPGDTTCNGGAWEVTWDFSGQSDGNILISVQQGSDPSVSRTLEKDTNNCDGVNNETGSAAIDARFGGSGGPHYVCNVEQMNRIHAVTANWSGKSFVLGNNIDLTTYAASGPIGTSSPFVQFTSSFVGDNFIFSNLTKDFSALPTSSGLFGYAISVSNFGIENIDIAVGSGSGGVLGVLVGINLYVTGFVDGSGSDNVGGIIGVGSCLNCFSTADVIGNDYVGGVAGQTVAGGTGLTATFSNSHVRGNDFVGGIFGQLGSGSSSELIANQLYSSGVVTAASGHGGGITGELISGTENFSLIDSYSSASVYCGGAFCGGIASETNPSTGSITITNVYSSGDVFGASQVGGVSGNLDGATLSNSFATNRSYGTGAEVGALVGFTLADATINNAFYSEGADCVGTENGASISCSRSNSPFNTSSTSPLDQWDFSTPVWKFSTQDELPILNWQD